jgi:hypothetical protein
VKVKERLKYEKSSTGSEWWSIYTKDIAECKDAWVAFGSAVADACAEGETPSP